MRRPIIETPRHTEAFSIEARAGAQQAPAAQLRCIQTSSLTANARFRMKAIAATLASKNAPLVYL
jgi:hypothetical protein